jgi:hypothetical protein
MSKKLFLLVVGKENKALGRVVGMGDIPALIVRSEALDPTVARCSRSLLVLDGVLVLAFDLELELMLVVPGRVA